MEQIWGQIVTYIVTAAGGGFFGWLFTRRKYNAEVDSTKVQNFDASIAAYKKMYEDMIDDLKVQNTELREEVNSLKQELSENRKQIITLTNFVLASAIKRADGEEVASLTNLKTIVEKV